MSTSRSMLVSADTTLYYHCDACRVRHAFLCGNDTVTGQFFSHCRQ